MKARGDQEKAAVLAALLQGQSVGAVAREYNIPKSTVMTWKKQNALARLNNSTPKKDIGELLIQYLRANLDALRKQSELFGDIHWLEKQSASEVAVLHGVMTDKAIRLIEAMSRANVPDNNIAKN